MKLQNSISLPVWFIWGVRILTNLRNLTGGDYRLAAIAFRAAFLFFCVADLASLKAVDFTRLTLDDFLLLAVLRLVVVRFLVVVLRFADRFTDDFLLILLMIYELMITFSICSERFSVFRLLNTSIPEEQPKPSRM